MLLRPLQNVPHRHRARTLWMAVTLLSALAACGGGGAAAGAYTLSGSVTGLTTEGLVLAQGDETVAVAAGAQTVAFEGSVSGRYSVEVLTQPDGQTCQVVQGSGTAQADVTDIQVRCRAYVLYVAHSLGGTLGQFQVGSGGALSALSPATVSLPALPSALAVAGDGSRAWVSYRDDESVTALAADALGALTVAGTGEAATFGTGLALSPDGRHLYATDYGGASVSQFSVSAAGAPVALSPSTVSAGLAPGAVAVTPDGAWAYVANTSGDSLSLYARRSNGTLQALSTATVSVADEGSKPQALAVHPTGSALFVALAGSAKVLSYRIDTTTGALTLAGSASTGSTPRALSLSPDGSSLYVANAGAGTLSQFSVSGTSLTPKSTRSVTTGGTPSGVAVSPDGRRVYVSNAADATLSQYAVGAGGLLSALAPATVAAGGLQPTALVVR